jgi:hypothetical protein
MVTEPPLTFASERGLVMRESNTCVRGGNRSAWTNESREKKKTEKKYLIVGDSIHDLTGLTSGTP